MAFPRVSRPAHTRETRRVLVASMDFRAPRVRPRIFPYTSGFVLAVHVHGNLRPAHLACSGKRLTIRATHGAVHGHFLPCTGMYRDRVRAYNAQYTACTQKVVHFRECTGERLRNFMVRVGPYEDFRENTPCGDIYSEIPSEGETIDVRCEEPISGRWVSVQLIGREDYLSLCECENITRGVPVDQVRPPNVNGGMTGAAGPGFLQKGLIGRSVTLRHVSHAALRLAVHGGTTLDVDPTFLHQERTQANVTPILVSHAAQQKVTVATFGQSTATVPAALTTDFIIVKNGSRWRADLRCGPDFPAPGAASGECDPVSFTPCCSLSGFCGSTEKHCKCEGCVDFRTGSLESQTNPITTTGVNVALNKMASQSSLLRSEYPAERAVDGNTGTILYPLKECTHTDLEYEPWWKVDLGDTYVISHVTVINRGDCCGERLRNFMVRVGPYEDFRENTPCGDIYTETPSEGETIDVRCEEPISGRWVSVQLIGREDYLSLCEVQVFSGTGEIPLVDGYSSRRGDCIGNDIWSIYRDATSLEDCARLCTSHPDCTSFMFYNNHRCYPKTKSCAETNKTNPRNVFYDRIIEKATGRKWREDYHCGYGYSAEGADPAECDPHSCFPCCSAAGWCGNTPDHCDCPGCTNYQEFYGIAPITSAKFVPEAIKRWRDDYRCGPDFPAPGADPGECDPHSCFPCCSAAENGSRWRADLRCGPDFPAPGAASGECDPVSFTPCCSLSGFCGSTEKHCKCEGCVDFRTGSGVSTNRTVHPQECLTDSEGTSYRGTIQHTKSGLTCQRWDTSFPHEHEYLEKYPNSGLDENYCRNPDGQPDAERPWCYTIDPDVRWEYCDIQECRVNVALNKMASQSSLLRSEYPAERAVDGNTGTILYPLKECTHTDLEYEPWWKVDLGDTYVISHVTVINRGDCCGERLRNFMVRVGPYEDFRENTPCGDIYSETPSEGETIDVRCEEPISGRWVSVQLIGREDYLSLCEVQVFSGTDNKTRPYLLCTTRRGISKLFLDSSAPPEVIQTPDMRSVIGVAFHWQKQMLFCTDVQSNAISRTYLNDTRQRSPKECGYPQWLIRKASEPRQPRSKPQDSQGTGGKNRKTLVVLPYVKGVSEPLRRIFAAHGVSTCFRPHRTLRQLLVAPKDKTPKEDKCGVIYHISCQGNTNRGPCRETYIGETERSLKTRFLEHRRPSSVASEVSQHIHIESPGHTVDLEGGRILDTEQDYFKRGIKEDIHFRALQPSLNRDGGGDIDFRQPLTLC
ncbi:hypothetical protein Bbelb_118210 [Branchiostoma belcheri]|nr:hypothetical protein Bbelb_118210 [Branchiostoma belcheri]